MAPGWWNKVKQFGSSVWNGIKKAGTTIAKVVKPVYNKMKPMLQTAGNAVGAAYGVPMAGTLGTAAADTGFDIVDSFNDEDYEGVYQKSGLDNIMSKKIKLR
jgi:hypothetical protein